MNVPGIFSLSGNFEIKYSGPIDSRGVRETKAELFDSTTWLDIDGNMFIYNGMPVIVWNDSITSNNGMYILINKNLFNLESSWLFFGIGNNSIFAGEKYSISDPRNAGDMSYSDDYLFICVLTGIAGEAIWKKTPLFKN